MTKGSQAVLSFLIAGCLLYVLVGFKNQESTLEQWVLSGTPTVQASMTAGEKVVVDPQGYKWVRAQIRARRGGVRRMGDEFGVTSPPQPGEGPLVQEWWNVFDPDDKKVATLELPPYVTAIAIGVDAVFGVSTDSQGVERVRVYGLDRGG